MESSKRIRLRYTVVDEEAFTEENFLIYNLFVYNLPKNVTAPLIKAYFEQFGKVLKVRLLINGCGKRSLVYFVDPKSAAKAILLETHHVFMNRVIRVEPCHSFRQPDGRKLIKQIEKIVKSESASPKTQQESLICTLNDNCLESIWLYLSLNDRINFALTCRSFCGIMAMSSRVNYKYVDTEMFNTCTLWNTIVFLHLIGPRVTKLKVCNEIESSLYKTLSSLCINVEGLEVANCRDTSQLCTLLQKMDKLESLEIDGALFTDKFVKYFRKFELLNLLFIEANILIRGKNLELLNRLDNLSLNFCARVTPKNFRKICANLTHLEYLDIRGCDLLRMNDFEYIPTHLKKLQCLKTCLIQEDIGYITRLPALVGLTLVQFEKTLSETFSLEPLLLFRDQMLEFCLTIHVITLQNATHIGEFKHLGEFRCCCPQLSDQMILKFSQLKHLLVVSFDYCDNVTSDAIFQFLQNCTKVWHMVLSDCYSITSEFIAVAAQLLREQIELGDRTQSLALTLHFHDEKKTHPKSQSYPGILEVTVYGKPIIN